MQGYAVPESCTSPEVPPFHIPDIKKLQLFAIGDICYLLVEMQKGKAQAFSVPPNRVKKVLLNTAILNLWKFPFLVKKVRRMHFC